MSYFEEYYNDDGEKTLRRYSRPINLTRFDSINWMTSEQDLWEIPDYLQVVSHRDLLPKGLERHLNRVDERSALRKSGRGQEARASALTRRALMNATSHLSPRLRVWVREFQDLS